MARHRLGVHFWMMRAPLGPLALAFLLLAAAHAFSEVEVQVNGAVVELHASAAPLSQVLERLAKQTGMELVFEGPAPQQRVTMTIRGRSPADTVLAVFEGLGMNYALVTDAAGTAVQMLVVASPTSSSSGVAKSLPSRPPVRRATQPRTLQPDLDPELEDDLGMDAPFDEPPPPDEVEPLEPPVPPGALPGVLPEVPPTVPGATPQAAPTPQPSSPFLQSIPYAPSAFARPDESETPAQPPPGMQAPPTP